MRARHDDPRLLCVDGLRVRYPGGDTAVDAVRDAGLTVGAGEIVGLVGASGSGKSTVLAAVARLLPPGAEVTARGLTFEGTPLLDVTERGMRHIRGRGLGMIFQDPRAALNPVMRVGDQIAEAARGQRGLSRRNARRVAEQKLERVGMPRPAETSRAYPHTLSGGMCQRAMIAMALVGEPRLLLADEPTTALDVTTQAGILDLLESLRVEHGMAVLLVTHDLRVVADRADRAVLMDRGRVVETAIPARLLVAPRHEAARRLVSALPRPGARKGPIPRDPASVSTHVPANEREAAHED